MALGNLLYLYYRLSTQVFNGPSNYTRPPLVEPVNNSSFYNSQARLLSSKGVKCVYFNLVTSYHVIA